jgi:hypothetical protein
MSVTNLAIVPPARGENALAALKSVVDKVTELGRVKGRGKNAEIEMMRIAVEASHNNEVEPDDATAIYDGFQGGEDATGEVTGTAADVKANRKQRISNVRQCIRLGKNKYFDPVQQMYNAIHVIGAAKKSQTIKGKKTLDCLVSVVSKQLANPEQPLDAGQMIEAAQPKVKRDKEMADRWGDQREAMARLLDLPDATDDDKTIAKQIWQLCQARIDSHGGTSAERRKADQLAKAAQAKADKKAKK